MGGAYFFALIIYLFRQTLHGLNRLRTFRWPEQSAKVLFAAHSGGSLVCPIVTIDYEYSIEGGKYADSYTKPFLILDSAKNYASDVSVRRNVDVRINPKDPSESVYLR
jgi:hypothetical protein